MNLSKKQTHRHRDRLVGAKGRRGRGRWMDCEFGVGRCKVLHLEWINKILLYSTGNYIRYPVINHNGGKHNQRTYICV